jgi:predicted transcriptional regulator
MTKQDCKRSRGEQLRQDVLAAWLEYRGTGRHVTAQEADVWLAGLEAGEEPQPLVYDDD